MNQKTNAEIVAQKKAVFSDSLFLNIYKETNYFLFASF